jgi:hypothetical protein
MTEKVRLAQDTMMEILMLRKALFITVNAILLGGSAIPTTAFAT